MAVIAIIICFVYSDFIPLKRINNSDPSNVLYTAEVRLAQNTTANMVVDAAGYYLFIYCCRSKHLSSKNRTVTFCSKQDKCSKNECVFSPSDGCPDTIYSCTKYSKTEGKGSAEAHKMKTTFGIDEFSVLTNNDGASPSSEYSRQKNSIDVTYVEDDYFKHTEGWLGLGFSPFPSFNFHRHISSLYKDDPRKAQVGLDLYTQEQRVENDKLLPNDVDRSIYSYGGNMMIGTDNINSYLYSAQPSSKVIMWSQPLRRFTSNIWSSLVTEPSTRDPDRYKYGFGHRFIMYDLSLECEDQVYRRLFYNYTGQWQAQIDTTFTGIALPTDFYKMLKRWKPDNDTHDPFVTFALEQDGRKLRFPMSWLQEELYDQNKEIQVYQRNVIISNGPIIRIGTKFLERHIVILDYSEFRIGFIEKQIIPHQPTCPPATQCEGSEVYYESTNECLAPACDAYFFQYYDSQSKECRMYVAFYVLFPVILGGLCMSEFLIYEIYRRLTGQLIARASANQ